MKRPDSETIGAIYDQFGESYHQSRRNASGRLFNECIDMPATFSLLPTDLTGKRILDAGCGSGIYAQRLAERGAQVTGIDASRKMIEIAEREKPISLEINYLVGDLYDLPFQQEFFDGIICTYVLENVELLPTVFDEFYRVLKKGGFCIFTISHPFRAYADRVDQQGKEVWFLENYFERGVRQSNFGDGMIVPKYKRPLEDYVKACTSAGFVIKQLIEPRPVASGQQIDPRNYEIAMRLPQLMALELEKL